MADHEAVPEETVKATMAKHVDLIVTSQSFRDLAPRTIRHDRAVRPAIVNGLEKVRCRILKVENESFHR